MVEEIASSASALEERAADLVESVGVLTLMQDRSQPIMPRSSSSSHESRPRPAAPTKPHRNAPKAVLSRGAMFNDGEQDWSSF